MLVLQLAQAVRQVRADGGGVGHQGRLEELDGRVGGGAGNRIPAERARVRPRWPRHDLRPRARHAKRQSRSDPLRDVHDVRLQIKVLRREHLPCPAHA